MGAIYVPVVGFQRPLGATPMGSNWKANAFTFPGVRHKQIDSARDYFGSDGSFDIHRLGVRDCGASSDRHPDT